MKSAGGHGIRTQTNHSLDAPAPEAQPLKRRPHKKTSSRYVLALFRFVEHFFRETAPRKERVRVDIEPTGEETYEKGGASRKGRAYREESGATKRPAGVITDRDITVRVVARGESSLAKCVRDAMTHAAVTAEPETGIEEAIRLMEADQVRRLLVTGEDGGLVGIVAQADLARRASAEETGEAVRGISRPSEAVSRPSSD